MLLSSGNNIKIYKLRIKTKFMPRIIIPYSVDSVLRGWYKTPQPREGGTIAYSGNPGFLQCLSPIRFYGESDLIETYLSIQKEPTITALPTLLVEGELNSKVIDESRGVVRQLSHLFPSDLSTVLLLTPTRTTSVRFRDLQYVEHNKVILVPDDLINQQVPDRIRRLVRPII
jgi:hypothetical protein